MALRASRGRGHTVADAFVLRSRCAHFDERRCLDPRLLLHWIIVTWILCHSMGRLASECVDLEHHGAQQMVFLRARRIPASIYVEHRIHHNDIHNVQGDSAKYYPTHIQSCQQSLRSAALNTMVQNIGERSR